jgi:hypothetical protein
MARTRFGSTRSRYRSIGAGDAIFAQAPISTSCPDGFHWVADAAPAIQGLGACVPNVAPLTLVIPAAAPATTLTTATAPAPATATCPALWPWWWLLVAAAAGASLGYYAQKNQKAVKKNGGRIVGAGVERVINAGSQAAIARLVG